MEMRVPGHILHDAGYGELVQVVAMDHPADGVLVTEILAGHGFGQDHGMRFGQGVLGIALQERDGEDIED